MPITAIGDVLAGRAAGRRRADEITVFDSSGISLQDLYIAEAVIKLTTTNSGSATKR
jgi:ornithine cyclodeaminase